jgi:dienelactone hydrolase
MQKYPQYTEIARTLAKHGFLSVILDPPAHGEDLKAGEPKGLDGWRARFEKGEDFVGIFTAHARAVLDYLVSEAYTDPNRVAACGVSRGGFLAIHFASVEPRIRAVGGLSPVTNLERLTEFRDTRLQEGVKKLSVMEAVPKLAGRPLWVIIGNDDSRVDTDQVISFTRAVVCASAQGKKDDFVIPVELLVCASAGHQLPPQASNLFANWILQQFGMGVDPSPQEY